MGNHPTLFKKFNKNQFKPDSVIIITGASSGMGKELCLRYAARQCKIVIAARRISELEALKDECIQKYSNFDILAVQTDVTIEE